MKINSRTNIATGHSIGGRGRGKKEINSGQSEKFVPHRQRQDNRVQKQQQCGCCGGDRSLHCCLPPPSASGLERLTIVEWRMQLLLKNKPPPRGGGGQEIAPDIDSTNPSPAITSCHDDTVAGSALSKSRELHHHLSQQLHNRHSVDHEVVGTPYDFRRHKTSELSQEPIEFYSQSPYHQRNIQQLSSNPPHHHSQFHDSPRHIYPKIVHPIHPHSLLMHRSSPDMSARACASVSSSSRAAHGSQAHVLDPSSSAALCGSPSSGSGVQAHPSPITGAAAYHPDIVAGCCSDSYQHRYNYHHHHHHHHHHAPLTPAIEVYSNRPGSVGSQSRRPPILEPAETIDPRFTPTCPCGGRLLRAASIDRLCKTGALSSDEGEGASAPSWKGQKPRGQKEEGGRRKKEGKGKMRRLVELTQLTAFFRPRKVRGLLE